MEYVSLRSGANPPTPPATHTGVFADSNGYLKQSKPGGSHAIDTIAVTTRLTDVSTASSAFVAAPCAGKVIAIYSVLTNAITGANSALTTEINGVAITGGSWTVAYSGSAAGDRDSATPTAANTVAAGDALEAITDGASSTASALDVTFVIQRT